MKFILAFAALCLLTSCSGQLQSAGGTYRDRDGNLHAGTYSVTPAKTNTSGK